MIRSRRIVQWPCRLSRGSSSWRSPGLHAQGPKFFSDDPLQREPETQDASKVQEWEIPLTPTSSRICSASPATRAPNVRAQNVNTTDEVPDSSWFTNRIYTRPVSIDEITKGPNTMDGPAPGPWTVIARQERRRRAGLHRPRRKR